MCPLSDNYKLSILSNQQMQPVVVYDLSGPCQDCPGAMPWLMSHTTQAFIGAANIRPPIHYARVPPNAA